MDRNQIRRIMERCQGAYAERTLRSYRNDLEHFRVWCEASGARALPASPLTIAAFIDDQTRTKALSTVRRRVEAVKFAHRMLDLPSPVANSEVKLALRRRPARQSRPPQAGARPDA